MNTLKAGLLARVIVELEREHAALTKALQDSSAAATDPDSKAEGKYDTRSLEMSYLAAGQSQQAEVLELTLEQLRRFEPAEFAITDAVDLGALVEVERGGEWEHYFLLPTGGGVEVSEQGVLATTLTPASPLFSELQGKRIGESAGKGLTISEVS